MKKSLLFLLAALLMISLFAGCTPSTDKKNDSTQEVQATQEKETEADNVEEQEEQPILPLKYYMPGSPSQQADAVNVAISKKMQEDGLNIDFEPHYVPWSEWVNKINIMLSSGDQFDLLHIMEDYVPTSTYASRDGLTPLDDIINEYTPEFWGILDDIFWTSVRVEGEVMAIPAYWRDNSGDNEGWMAYCKTRFDEYGLEIPTTTQELLDTLAVLQEKQKEETGIEAYMYEHANNGIPAVGLHRTYDAWPFFTSLDGMFSVDQDGKASLFFETEEFKLDCEFMNEAYKMNLVHPDVLNLPKDTIGNYKKEGNYLLGIQTTGGDVMDDEGNIVLDFEKFTFNPDDPYLCNMPVLNSNAVPSTSKNPELGVQFLYWMYSNKDNQNLVLYGVEGEHWEKAGDDEYTIVKDESNTKLYGFDAWMIEYVPNHIFDAERTTSESEDRNFMINIYPDKTVNSPVIGFNFDSEKVSVEFSNMVAEYNMSMLPIKKGVVSYEEGFESAMEKMKAAGCDVVIAEYQRQLDEYIKSKNN